MLSSPLFCWKISIHALREESDIWLYKVKFAIPDISIHALREESDTNRTRDITTFPLFQSTPSARRATLGQQGRPQGRGISIHALREESDRRSRRRRSGSSRNFNPRPPRGERRRLRRSAGLLQAISIHALREESDKGERLVAFGVEISIHALREESDLKGCEAPAAGWVFQSTPSARRATQVTVGEMFGILGFQSTPSARRATAKAAKKSTTFVPLYTLVHNLKRNFTKAPAK